MTSAGARQLSEPDMSLSRLPSHSRTLFVREDGAPMRFYVRPGPLKRQLSPLIAHGGGVMCRVQESGVILLAQPGETHGPEFISTEYVKECVRRDQQLDAEEYWLSPGPKHKRGGRGAVRGQGSGKTGEVQHDGGVPGGTMNDRCVIQEKSEAASNTGVGDLRIFEIANLEFQIEDSLVEMTPTKRCTGLREFVMEEDSISPASMTQVDEVSSSPDVSEAEGLQKALLDMMSEFSLPLCDVTQALLKNNGEIGSTRHFLRTGARPDEYPIWERKDDLDLETDGPTCHERLAQKYGADNVAKRVAFLAS